MTLRVSLTVAVVCLACLLFFDATSYAMMPEDLALGLRGGCYTEVELWVGVKQPSFIRDAELVGGFVLLALTPFLWASARREQHAAVTPNSVEGPLSH